MLRTAQRGASDAARGPAPGAYPWGDGAPGCGKLNYADCVGDATTVGYYPLGSSWCQALDMAGNAWEWVSDWYQDDYYSVSPANNPAGPQVGTYKVVRGGGWSSVENDVRSVYRLNNAPENSNNDLGFRCALP